MNALVCDLGALGIDGWDLIELARAVHHRTELHRIVMSNCTEARSRQRAFERGGDQHVVKEVRPARIVAALRARLARESALELCGAAV